MTAEKNYEGNDREYDDISEIGNRVRYIQRRVGEISAQLDDHYHLLREIWESATSPENGTNWYDLYEMDEGDG